MRACFVAFALAASLAVVAAPLSGIGKQAPVFTLTDQNGKTVALSAMRGRKVVLVFYRGYW
jgi:cytochrome oxidase Cu insertion factor (SCO1/SenC/PrrC family)